MKTQTIVPLSFIAVTALFTIIVWWAHAQHNAVLQKEVSATLDVLAENSPLIAKECEHYQARTEAWLDRSPVSDSSRRMILRYHALCAHDAPMGLVGQLLADVHRREPYACAQAAWALSDMAPEARRREAAIVDEVYQLCCKPVVEDSAGRVLRMCPVLAGEVPGK